MHPRFGEQHPVRVVAKNGQRRTLDTRLITRLKVDDVALEAATLGPAQIHAKQHLGPVLRFGSTGSRVNAHARVLAIVFAPQHLLRLASIDRRRKVVEALGEVVSHRLAGFGPLDQHREILGSSSQRLTEIAILLQPSTTLKQFLRGRLILPEVRIGDALFYRGKFVGAAGSVKDSSAGRMRGESSPDTCEAVRRVVWA